MLPVVIAMPERQTAEVLRLIEYCYDLDGTRVQAFPISKAQDEEFKAANPGFTFPCLQAFGLNFVARQMHGKPFIWLEPDSIPLKKGWVKRLSEEYDTIGKPFLISSDTHPPHDLVGGIGVYPGNTAEIVPTRYRSHGWDLWLIRHVPQLLGRTPLIQHTYGNYDRRGNCQPWRFPLNRGVVRDDALVFHRDRHQDLIMGGKRIFFHTGDLGDVIAGLPVMRQMGGGKLQVSNDPSFLRPIKGARFEALKALVEAQSYISSVEYVEAKDPSAIDFSTFRKELVRGRSLTEAQAVHVKAGSIDLTPWLTATPSAETKGRIAVARSPRYHNNSFPWARLVERNQGRLTFIGLEEEYAAFKAQFRGNIPWIKTTSLLQIAELIAGADAFIGNQSSPCWIAMGLGVPVIQETHPGHLNSIIHRPNSRFVQGNRVPPMPSVNVNV